MKRFYTIIFLALTCLTVLSQPLSQKQIKRQLQDAQILFDTDDFLSALKIYKTVLRTEPKNETANLNALICEMKLGNPVDSVLSYYQVVQTSRLTEALYYAGLVNHKLKSFDIAIDYLNKYKMLPQDKRKVDDAEVNHMTEVCNNAKKEMQNPHKAIIKNMGDEINSVYADFVPVITPDESLMYFTSRREGSSGGAKDIYGNYEEDIYVSYHRDGKWTKAENAGAPFNTVTNDGCVALSPDGQRMIVYRTEPDGATGHLYVTRKGVDDKWGPLQKYGNEINSQFVETSACFSSDTSEIYFSSNRPGGYGGKDIFRIKKLPNGKWGQAFNLGPNINTTYDEDAPFLHPDGVTLFFSSKGHSTMGDYDVFKSTLNTETNVFSAPENMGSPLNTVNNDIFFVLNGDGKRGYYSSVKDDSKGSTDIYMVDTRFGDNDLLVKHALVMKGDVPGKAKITLLDNDNRQVSGIYNASAKTGKFILVMNPLRSYKAIVEEEGYNTAVIMIDPMAYETEESELIIKLTKK